MDSRTGQMFLNYAYSWGAAIVILGALFKLTHIHGADLMLFIGMGTEVIVFFLSGFERPWRDDGVEEVQQSAIQNVAIETIPEEGDEEDALYEAKNSTELNAVPELACFNIYMTKEDIAPLV